jgi:hypothetical protein
VSGTSTVYSQQLKYGVLASRKESVGGKVNTKVEGGKVTVLEVNNIDLI